MKKIYPAIGKSMLSFIQPKDFLLIDTNELMDFEFGDIIVYKNSASILLAHRFIVKNSDYVLVAGDNCRRFEKISVSQIVGKVLLIIKGKDIYPIHKKNMWKKICAVFMLLFIPLNNMTVDFVIENRKKTIWGKICIFISNQLYKYRNKIQKKYLLEVQRKEGSYE